MKTSRKALLPAIAACGLIFALSACGSPSAADDPATSSTNDSAEQQAGSTASAESVALDQTVEHDGSLYVDNGDGTISMRNGNNRYRLNPGETLLASDGVVNIGDTVATDLYEFTLTETYRAENIELPEETLGNWAEGREWFIIKGTLTNKRDRELTSTDADVGTLSSLSFNCSAEYGTISRIRITNS